MAGLSCADLLHRRQPTRRIAAQEYDRHHFWWRFFCEYQRPRIATCGFVCDIFGQIPRTSGRVLGAPAFVHEMPTRLLIPHLDRATATTTRLGPESDIALQVLDRLDSGVFFVSCSGTLVGSNSAGIRLLKHSEGLCVTAGGVLVAVREQERHTLQVLLARSCRFSGGGASPTVQAMLLAGTSTDPALEILVTPLRRDEPHDAGSAEACVAVIARQSIPFIAPLTRLQHLFGVTEAEGRVAQQLARGKSVGDIAAEQGVSVSTVRTHVRRLLAKMGAASISDLTRRLGCLMPIR